MTKRELQRRHSDENEKHKRDLTQAFDAARDQDPEFITDEEMQAGAEPAAPAAQVQPGGDEFWLRMSAIMDMKLDTKVDQLAKSMGVALHDVELRLGDRPGQEE